MISIPIIRKLNVSTTPPLMDLLSTLHNEHIWYIDYIKTPETWETGKI